MFNKLGRAGGGGGRGNGKRPLLRPSTHGTRPVGKPSSRLSSLGGPTRIAGGGRGCGDSGGGQVQEETFSMVSDGVLDFAAIIRLTPEIVEEIQRAESSGGVARIKFDTNMNDTGNVIEIDGKEFRFTWSKEFGDLCDIYEERQSGEDGNGLLAECGSAWRKLNVQRILDESIKNRVKMRSEEAERQQKSRRAIVLDPTNPSVKNQSSAAVEGSMRRMQWKSKEPLFKKQKVDSSQAPKVSVAKAAIKPGASPKFAAKGRQSASPLPSPPEKLDAASPTSPYLTGKVSATDVIIPVSNAENTFNTEKEMIVGQKGGINSQASDLRGMLINLLSENPKGMSLKAIEKAVGEMMPNAAKKIDSVLKKIGNYVTPGRYFLKTGVGMDGIKRHPSESGSSPETAREGSIIAELPEKTAAEEYDLQSPVHSKEVELGIFDGVVKQKKPSGAIVSDRSANDEVEEKHGSSSESGSDSESESDSSGSGSESGSQSRSRSPQRSGSASSSDSESDGSSSSKETDVHVDITTSDDDREDAENNLFATELKLSSSPKPLNERTDKDQLGGRIPSPLLHSDGSGRDIIVTHAVGNTKDALIDDIVKMPENFEIEVINNTGLAEKKSRPKKVEHMVPFSSGEQMQVGMNLESSGGILDSDKLAQVVQPNVRKQTKLKEGYGYEQHKNARKAAKSDSKRSYEMQNYDENVENAEKSKFRGSSQSTVHKKDINFSKDMQLESYEKAEQNKYGDSLNSQTHGVTEVPRKHVAHGSQPGVPSSSDLQDVANLNAKDIEKRPGDLNPRWKSSNADKSDKYLQNLDRGGKHGRRQSSSPGEPEVPTLGNMSSKDKISLLKDKYNRDIRDDGPDTNEKYSAKLTRDVIAEDYRQLTEQTRMQKNTGLMNKSETVNLSSGTDKRNALKRELSELELGEFREPFSVGRKHSEGKSSIISNENRVNNTENSCLNISNGKSSGKVIHENKRKSSSTEEGKSMKRDGGLQRKMAKDIYDAEGLQRRAVISESQQLPRAEGTDSADVYHFDRFPSNGWDENRGDQFDLENLTSGYKKTPSSPPNANFLVQAAPTNRPGSKQQRLREVREPNNQRANILKRDSKFIEEDASFFSKFEKDDPELRGPIKEFSQYKEYVQEYEEKYECYLALNESIEKIRDEFLKVGTDLPELAKGENSAAYKDCCRQVMRFHSLHKMRFTRMKKTFVVLYEELKTIKERIKNFAEEYTKE